jgi:hypothetical protein
MLPHRLGIINKQRNGITLAEKTMTYMHFNIYNLLRVELSELSNTNQDLPPENIPMCQYNTTVDAETERRTCN